MSKKISQLLFIAGLVAVASNGGNVKADHGESCNKLQVDCLTGRFGCGVWETHEAVKTCSDLIPNPLSAVARKDQNWGNACYQGCLKAQTQGWCKKAPDDKGAAGVPCAEPQ